MRQREQALVALRAAFLREAKTADRGEAYGIATNNRHLEECARAEAKVWRRAAEAIERANEEDPS